MVQSNGGITNLTIKARFGNDIRRTQIHHTNDLTLVDLLLKVQRTFGLSNDHNLVLKYKDNDGDLISLIDDSDLLLALNSKAGDDLDITLTVDSKDHASLQNILQHIESIKHELTKLSDSLTGIDHLTTLVESCSISTSHIQNSNTAVSHKNFNQAPLSPVPSEKPEIPATIQPSLQEQVLSENYHRAPVEEEISLEKSTYPTDQVYQPADSHNSSFSQPQHNEFNQFAPPPTTIPSFPNSNAALPPVQTFNSFGGPPPTQGSQFNAPPTAHSQSSVASTPVPHHGGYQDQQQQQFAPPPMNEQHQQQQNFGMPPPNTGSFAPPPTSSGPGSFAPPPQGSFGQAPPGNEGFNQPPMGGQGFGAPPLSAGSQGGFGGPPSVGGFNAAPPSGGFGGPPSGGNFNAPPPGGNFNAPPPGAFNAPPSAPGSFAPPQGQGAFAAPPPGSFAPPPSGGPGQFAPPPTGFAPPSGGPPGGNPFARGPGGPGYRQSPYQQ